MSMKEPSNKGSKATIDEKLERVLDITDLNIFIGSLKKREENLIQLLDYNLKFGNSENIDDIKQIKTLHNELFQLEKSREMIEDDLVFKYLDLKVSDLKQKK
jgi:hypothetical protein